MAQDDESKKSSEEKARLLVAWASPSSFLLALACLGARLVTALRRHVSRDFGGSVPRWFISCRNAGPFPERILPARSEGLRIAAVSVQCLCRGDTVTIPRRKSRGKTLKGCWKIRRRGICLVFSTITYNTTDNIFPDRVTSGPIPVYVNLYFRVYLLKSSNKLLRDHYRPTIANSRKHDDGLGPFVKSMTATNSFAPPRGQGEEVEEGKEEEGEEEEEEEEEEEKQDKETNLIHIKSISCIYLQHSRKFTLSKNNCIDTRR
ncbi:hypothetical protein V1478_011811 [Vespula squamosa]|uniref:Uncharacterized protein n=1 Tax=Vespula squamosa TaxID=30214 RepID=A0ABD2AE11_VESSQ